jgi:hypothetical protein
MDYKNGKVYCIRNNINDEIYVGSTTQSLSQRMAKHRGVMNHDTKKHRPLYKLMSEIGIEHFYIELIEECPCDNKEQLMKKEGEFIRQQGTLNKFVAGRTYKEWRIDNSERIREQVIQNREHKCVYNKEYQINNREQLKEKAKTYREQNIDVLKTRCNDYKKKNKEQLKEKAQVSEMCDICGSCYTHGSRSRHMKTKKHQTALRLNQIKISI